MFFMSQAFLTIFCRIDNYILEWYDGDDDMMMMMLWWWWRYDGDDDMMLMMIWWWQRGRTSKLFAAYSRVFSCHQHLWLQLWLLWSFCYVHNGKCTEILFWNTEIQLAKCSAVFATSSMASSPVRYIDIKYRLSIYRHFWKISIAISISIWRSWKYRYRYRYR